MPEVNEAAINTAGIMGGGTIIVSVLGAKTPATSLPKGAIFDDMTRSVMIALETVRELDLSSPTLLTEYSAVFQTVFSFFNIRWTLGSEDA